MNTAKPPRPRPRVRFTPPLEPLEPRTLLNGAVDVGVAQTPGRSGPMVTVKVTSNISGHNEGPAASNSWNLIIYGEVDSPGSRIDVYATPRRGKPILIGQDTPMLGSTAWAVYPNPTLADGAYTIHAQAVNIATGLAGELTQAPQKLNLDNVGPRIVGVRLMPRRGLIVLTFRDFGGNRNAGSGIDVGPATYPGAYDFKPLSGSEPAPADGLSLQTIRVDLSPVRPIGVQSAVVTINGGAPILDGSYRFSIRSPGPVFPSFEGYPPIHIPGYVWGLRDVAGNPLEGGPGSTIAPADSNDLATAFVVRGGMAFRPRAVTQARPVLTASRSPAAPYGGATRD